MTESIMKTDELEGPRRRRSTNIVVIGLIVTILLVIAITVGVVVGGQNKSASAEDVSASNTADVGNLENTGIATDPTSSPTPLRSVSLTSTITSSPTRPPTTAAPSTTTAVSLTDPPTPLSSTSTILPTIASPFSTATPTVGNGTADSPGEMISGTTESGMAYLRCSGDATVASNQKQIVLLHGSSFSKETWESGDMLNLFCDGSQIVIALDFPVSTDYLGLIQVLDDLTTGGQLPLLSTPVTLVTPSASGYSVVSWLMNGDISQLPDYISEWVPVATSSLVSASDDEIAAVKDLPGFRILAINGNDDQAGGKYSTRLADLAGATAVELTGRHAVYLQSPDGFVQTILNF